MQKVKNILLKLRDFLVSFSATNPCEAKKKLFFVGSKVTNSSFDLITVLSCGLRVKGDLSERVLPFEVLIVLSPQKSSNCVNR